jgi:hypothetical protein
MFNSSSIISTAACTEKNSRTFEDLTKFARFLQAWIYFYHIQGLSRIFKACAYTLAKD